MIQQAKPAPDPIAHSCFALDPSAALERVPVTPVAERSPLDERVLVHSIHDGDVLPAALSGLLSDPVARRKIEAAFVRERDFGADAVAEAISSTLGLSIRLRNRLARAVLDVGRFFGLDSPGTGHLDRLAVPPPAAAGSDDEIDYLNDCFSAIESRIAAELFERRRAPRLAVGVHTYDPAGPDGTPRPEVSVLHVPHSAALGRAFLARYREPPLRSSELPTTCDERLVLAIVESLRQAGFRVGRNEPYLLPDGGVEVRLHHAARVRDGIAGRRVPLLRPNTLVVEVRKDLLFEGDSKRGHFAPRGVIKGAASRIGTAIGAAIRRPLAAIC